MLINGIQADSLQMTQVVNPAIGCHYLLLSPRLPSLLQNVTAIGRRQFILLGEQKHMFVNVKSRVAANFGRYSLSRDAMLARYYAVVVCRSVRPYVWHKPNVYT